jgi:hypothetical protein
LEERTEEGREEKRTVLAEESDHRVVVVPYDVLNERRRDLSDDLLLLNVEEDNARRGGEEETRRSAEENVAGLNGALDRLGDRVVEVADLDVLTGAVENSEAVASDEEGRRTGSTLSVRRRIADLARGEVLREANELVETVVGGGGDDDGLLGGVVGEGARLLILSTETTDGDDARVLTVGEVVSANVLVADVEEGVAVRGEGGTLTVELEDDQSRVVTGGEEVELRVSGEDPEAVVLATEGLNGGALRHVPHADRLVLRVRDDELVLGVEER